MKDPIHHRPPLAWRRAGGGLLERPHDPLPFLYARVRSGVVGEDTPEIEAVVELENHHEPASVDQDFHVSNTGAAKTLLHLGPHPAVVLAIAGDRPGIFAKIHGQHVSTHETRREVLYFTAKVKDFWAFNARTRRRSLGDRQAYPVALLC